MNEGEVRKLLSQDALGIFRADGTEGQDRPRGLSLPGERREPPTTLSLCRTKEEFIWWPMCVAG